jgi:hypothetical protein
MSSTIERGCPEATKEVSGVVECAIEAIAFAKCPITLSGYCEFPKYCIGCYEVIDGYLEALQ